MTPEIKQRIEQIQNGIVPKGYKQTPFGIYPANWVVGKLGDYIEEYSVLSNEIETYPVYSSSRKGLLLQSQYFDNREAVKTNLGYKMVPSGYVTYRHMSDDDIFYFNRNTTGKTILVSSEYPVFTNSEYGCLDYLITLLNNTSRFRYFCRTQKMGGTRTRLYFKRLCQYRTVFPHITEQLKISEILNTQGKVIELTEKRIEQLKQIKKYYLQNMFPKHRETVPKIRFKGFTDAWEQRKLVDCFDFLQNNTLSREALQAGQGVAINVHYGDVLIKFGEYLDIATESISYIPSQSIVDKFKGSLLADGDVIMADTAEDETVGKCSEIVGLRGKVALSGLHTIPLRPIKKFASGFLGYYMNSGAYHDQLLPLMQGIKVTSISKSAIKGTNIYYPDNLMEQASIGQFFILLDNFITLHQRKLEEEKRKKKSLAQLLLSGIVRVKV